MARPRTFDETETLDAICEQFWETGYAGTSLENLMESTGLGKGSLYAAFGSKHEMFVRAFKDYCDDVTCSTAKALDGDDAGAFKRLEAYVRRTIKSPDPRGCMLAKTTAEIGGIDGEIDHLISGAFGSMEASIIRCLQAAHRSGELPKNADPVRLGRVVVAVLRGIESLKKGGASQAILKSIGDETLSLLRGKSGAPARS